MKGDNIEDVNIIPIRYERPRGGKEPENVIISVEQTKDESSPSSIKHNQSTKSAPKDVPKIRHTRNKKKDKRTEL